MDELSVESHRSAWSCLYCFSPLGLVDSDLVCEQCGAKYPVISGIAILVKEPLDYLRMELRALLRASDLSNKRRELVSQLSNDGARELSDSSLERHRDVIESEISQIDTFLSLLEPAKTILESSGMEGQPGVTKRSGWTVDGLLPYLVRDWTNSPELNSANSLIGQTLADLFPNPAEKVIAVAGCGAAGMLAAPGASFGKVIGFDLTLPILTAARHLLAGKTLTLRLPNVLRKTGPVLLSRSQTFVTSPLMLCAMDAFNTAFADNSVDCVLTSFFMDLISEPQRLAAEIHRILRPDGVWLNYGPPGPVNASWRFDDVESAAFFKATGFSPILAKAHRTTYMDLSGECPNWSSRIHTCYLTAARKAGPRPERPPLSSAIPKQLGKLIPRHYPSANIIQRQNLHANKTQKIILRFEKWPGQIQSVDITSQDACLLELVDGIRTIDDIAELAKTTAGRGSDDTFQAFRRYLELGLLQGPVSN